MWTHIRLFLHTLARKMPLGPNVLTINWSHPQCHCTKTLNHEFTWPSKVFLGLTFVNLKYHGGGHEHRAGDLHLTCFWSLYEMKKQTGTAFWVILWECTSQLLSEAQCYMKDDLWLIYGFLVLGVMWWKYKGDLHWRAWLGTWLKPTSFFSGYISPIH